MSSRGGKVLNSELYDNFKGPRTTATRRKNVKNRVYIKSVKIKEPAYIISSDLYYDYRSDGKKIARILPLDKVNFTRRKYNRIKKAISNNVKKLREEKSLTCEAVAIRSNMTRQYIGQIEKGEKNITLEKLCDLASAFDVDVEFLINEAAFDIREGYIRNVVAEIKKLPKRKQIDLCINIIKKLEEGEEHR